MPKMDPATRGRATAGAALASVFALALPAALTLLAPFELTAPHDTGSWGPGNTWLLFLLLALMAVSATSWPYVRGWRVVGAVALGASALGLASIAGLDDVGPFELSRLLGAVLLITPFSAVVGARAGARAPAEVDEAQPALSWPQRCEQMWRAGSPSGALTAAAVPVAQLVPQPPGGQSGQDGGPGVGDDVLPHGPTVAAGVLAPPRVDVELSEISAIYRGSWGPLLADLLVAAVRPSTWRLHHGIRRLSALAATLLLFPTFPMLPALFSSVDFARSSTSITACKRPSAPVLLDAERSVGLTDRVFICQRKEVRRVTSADVFGSPLGFGLAALLWPVIVTLPARGERAVRARGGPADRLAVNQLLVGVVAFAEVALMVGFSVGDRSALDFGESVLWGLAIASGAHLGAGMAAFLLKRWKGEPLYVAVSPHI